MPDEVFEMWIAHGLQHGLEWKFSPDSETAAGTDWEGFFGHKSLTFWRNADWTLTSIIPSPELFHLETKARVIAIIGWCVYGKQTPTANVHDSKNRFATFTEIIRKAGKLPCPVVGAKTGDGLEIVDGNHRLAAVVYLELANSLNLPIWIAH
jgi:hypothetical protein